MDPTASGEQLQEFWEKHSQLKQEYGTNDSYHKSDKEVEAESAATSGGSKPNFAEMVPVVQLQNEGKLAEAWEVMKSLSTFEYLKQMDPTGMGILEQTNEAGNFELAFDMSMKHNMQMYGPGPLKAWGYSDQIIQKYSDQADDQTDEYAEWGPVIQLQNQGKLAEAWEIMKNLKTFDALVEKDPEGMAKLTEANENGFFQEAFDGMMIHNISTYGADLIRAWGYSNELVAKYSKMAVWVPIMKLQQSGQLEAAWEETKQLKEFWAKMENNPQLKEFKELNEAGQFQEAYDKMISYKIMVKIKLYVIIANNLFRNMAPKKWHRGDMI